MADGEFGPAAPLGSVFELCRRCFHGGCYRIMSFVNRVLGVWRRDAKLAKLTHHFCYQFG